MFKKKPTVKPLAPLRSSDRRKLADQIIQDYGLSINVAADASDEDKAAGTAQHTQLRNALLPDNIQTCRFTTTQGPELKPVSGTLYVGKHEGQDARVLWFNLDGRMYPSVYTLWQNPGITPLLHTPEAVVQKLQGGANLMTPGLAGPPFPSKATKGATVAIASLDFPSVPVAVGICAIDIASLTTTSGAKGHAVDTLHWEGDEIWSFSTANKPGRPAPGEIAGWLPSDEVSENVANAAAQISFEDKDESGVSLGAPAGSLEKSIEQKDLPDHAEVVELEAKTWTTKEIDSAFHDAFLFGVHQHITSNASQPNYGLNFPLSQSIIMSTLIQPFLPAFTPEDTKQLQIKNSSFKGLKKFIKSLDKEQLVRSKDKQTEVVILDIDFKDSAFTNFKPYKLPKKGGAPNTQNGDSHPISDSDPAIGQVLTLRTLYKISERLDELFSPAKSSHYLEAPELKAAIAAYIERHKLASTSNKRLVNLDDFLTQAFFRGSSSIDAQVRAQGSVARDALADRALAACTPHWTLTRKPADGGNDSTTKPKAGQPPKVLITLETRSGNKTVTKVSGLEKFSISVVLLAEELKKVCAGSTSVDGLAGASPKDGLQEVMVQGPQREQVVKALEKRGVKAGWVEVVDKTKKKK